MATALRSHKLPSNIPGLDSEATYSTMNKYLKESLETLHIAAERQQKVIDWCVQVGPAEDLIKTRGEGHLVTIKKEITRLTNLKDIVSKLESGVMSYAQTTVRTRKELLEIRGKVAPISFKADDAPRVASTASSPMKHSLTELGKEASFSADMKTSARLRVIKSQFKEVSLPSSQKLSSKVTPGSVSPASLAPSPKPSLAEENTAGTNLYQRMAYPDYIRLSMDIEAATAEKMSVLEAQVSDLKDVVFNKDRLDIGLSNTMETRKVIHPGMKQRFVPRKGVLLSSSYDYAPRRDAGSSSVRSSMAEEDEKIAALEAEVSSLREMRENDEKVAELKSDIELMKVKETEMQQTIDRLVQAVINLSVQVTTALSKD